MSNQLEQADTALDEMLIPVDVSTIQTTDIEPADVPAEIQEITRGLASSDPPTNPLVVLTAARWWYVHGRGGTDPAFLWALEWTRHLATDTPGDVDRFDAFLAYLVDLGFADEKRELRTPSQ